MRIDAHQHFWTLSRGDYPWPTPDLPGIYRDFGPEDLAPLLDDAGVDGTVLVQATATFAETRFLLELAKRHSFVKGVIGWADLAAPDAPAVIADLSCDALLMGLRPMVQNLPDTAWLLRDDLRPAFETMIEHDLALDALILPRHLPVLERLLHALPSLRVVIDHAAKPPIATGAFGQWADDMVSIARNTGAYCKVSGLWTEAGCHTDVETIGRYVDHLLACFGPDRLMWGSDWPVVRLAGDYEDWCKQCEGFFAHLPSDRQDAIFGGNARSFYGLA